jgi:hypothetical protein
MEQSFTPADNGAEAVEAARKKAVAARQMWEHQWELGGPLLPYALAENEVTGTLYTGILPV